MSPALLLSRHAALAEIRRLLCGRETKTPWRLEGQPIVEGRTVAILQAGPMCMPRVIHPSNGKTGMAHWYTV